MSTSHQPTSTSDPSSSFATLPSDSENYASSSPDASAPSPPSETSSSPLILYKPPTLWGLLRGAAINLLLPFVNGLMLGFGELVANEAAYRLGWSGTKVCYNFFRRFGWMDGWDGKDGRGVYGKEQANRKTDFPDAPSRRRETRWAGRRDARGSGGEAEEGWRGTGYVHCAGVGVGREGM